MTVTVHLPTVLAALADGRSELAGSGDTVGAVVEHLADTWPRLAPRLRDGDGAPYPFVTYYLNDEDVRFADGFATPVRDGDELVLVPAIAGG